MPQPQQINDNSLRLDGPALGLGLDEQEVDDYLALARSGVIAPQTGCGAVQNNFALRTENSVALTPDSA